MDDEKRVGSKGELFPPKEVREKLGLRPRMKVIYRIEAGRLVVEPIPTVEDVLKEPPVLEIGIGDFHRFRRELSKRAEGDVKRT
ncbi:MAG: AbrB/MazE/SpoVT family DNA-binding domain-containing protein [Candidatus Bathyarchaeia archaeon]